MHATHGVGREPPSILQRRGHVDGGLALDEHRRDVVTAAPRYVDARSSPRNDVIAEARRKCPSLEGRPVVLQQLAERMQVVAVAAALAIIHQNHDVVVGRPAPGPAARRGSPHYSRAAPWRDRRATALPFVRELERAAAPRTAPVAVASLI